MKGHKKNFKIIYQEFYEMIYLSLVYDLINYYGRGGFI